MHKRYPRNDDRGNPMELDATIRKETVPPGTIEVYGK